MADVDFTKLVAAINKLESTMSSRSSSGTTGTTGASGGNSNPYTKTNEEIRKQIAAIEELNQKDKALLDTKQKLIAATRAQADALKEQIRLAKEANEPLGNLAAEVEELENKADALEGASESQERFNGLIQTSLGFGRKNIVSLLAQKGGLQGLADSLRENITVQNIANSLLSKFIEASVAGAFALNTLRSEFIKTTGASEELTNRLGDVDTLNLSIGVGMREIAQSMTAVRQGLSGVALLSTEAQISLAEFTAANERLGVESATTIRNIDSLTKAFGQTTREAEATSNEIIRFGLSLGVSASQISEDFTEATPFIVQFGDNAIEVFEELQAQAQATGIAMGSLISVVERLDTFQGAQEAVQGLNAALGTSLNAFELFEAEGVDKIEMLQGALLGSGVEFGQLNRHMQRFIAQESGFSNVAEAARVFNGTALDQAAALRQVSQEQQDLDERRQLTLSIQEKLTNAAQAFALAAEPIVIVLDHMASGIQFLATSFGNWGATIAVVSGALLLFNSRLILSAGFQLASRNITILDSAAKSANAFVTGLQSKANENLAKSTKGAGLGLLKMGVGALLLGAGIGIAAYGMAQFVSAFQGMGAEEILATSTALIAFGAAVVAFAFAATLAAKAGTPGLIFIGLLSVAFLALGGGVMMMAEGLTQMSGMSSSLISLAAAAPGLLAVGVALAGISTALWSMPNEEMINFAGAMDAYSSAIEASAQSPEAVREMRETISTAATIEAGAGLASLFAGMAAMATAIGGLGQRPVQIRVNERVLGDSVVDVFNDRIRGELT